MARLLLPVLLLALLVGSGARAGEEGAPRLEVKGDAVEIAASTTLAPGTWTVLERDGAGVLRIHTDGVVLDLGGATLRGAPPDTPGDTLQGVGILVEGARNVTIRGGRVAGFRVGIRAVNAPGLTVEDVDASGNYRQRLGSTPEREDASDWLWPHHNDEGEWEERYGAGLSLNDCTGATVRRCRVHRGQNGLLLTRCTGCEVYDNEFSFNSGWGVALYRTTKTTVAHNRLDFCVRGYSHGVYFRGQDSAAILVFEQSSDNLFVRNSATHSGDGFFLYAGHETTQRTGRGGSSRNRVFANDFRFAVANGIEATFSEGNVFALNDCSGADHGIWAGYSYASSFLFNRAFDCRSAGISVEHGHDNVYGWNEAGGARYGIHLWWDPDPDLVGGVYGRTQDCASARNWIHHNRLAGTVAALRLDTDRDSRIRQDVFPGDPARIQLVGATRPAELAYPTAAGRLVLENRTGGPLELMDPRLGDRLVVEGDPVRLTPWQPPPPGTPATPPQVPATPGSLDPTLPADFPAGRAAIRIDEWGPVDPRETRLFPARQQAAGPAASVHLLGDRPYEVVAAEGGVTVRPERGTAPATLVVEAMPGGPALRAFRVTVASAGQRHVAEGTLLRLPWQVRHVPWSEAQDPLTHPEAFSALLEGPGGVQVTAEALDFPWQGRGPAGVPADGFATRATAEADLPAGRYRLRVVSDDGVRVWVDGRLVIERWDRHGPTEDVADVDLAAGSHGLRVDHFEIDGWAWLTLRLELLGAAPR